MRLRMRQEVIDVRIFSSYKIEFFFAFSEKVKWNFWVHLTLIEYYSCLLGFSQIKNETLKENNYNNNNNTSR